MLAQFLQLDPLKCLELDIINIIKHALTAYVDIENVFSTFQAILLRQIFYLLSSFLLSQPRERTLKLFYNPVNNARP